MPLNRIKTGMTDEQENQVNQLFKDIEAILHFLIGLPDEERIRLAKGSRRSLGFIEQTLKHAKHNPDFLYGVLTLERYEEMVKLIKRLHRLNVTVDALHGKIKDTIIAAEEEAYAMTRLYYNSVKTSAKEGEAEAERIFQDLAYYFKNKRSSKKDEKITDVD